MDQENPEDKSNSVTELDQTPDLDDEETMIKGLSEELAQEEKNHKNRDNTVNLPKEFDIDHFISTFGKFKCGEKK